MMQGHFFFFPINKEPTRGVRFGFRTQKHEIYCGSLFLGTRTSAGFSFSGNWEPVVACYEMKDKLYPDTSVSQNAQKRFFRRIP